MSNLSNNPLWRQSIGPNAPPPDWVNAPHQPLGRLFTPYEKVISDAAHLEVVFNARFAMWLSLGFTAAGTILLATIGFIFNAAMFGVFISILGLATCSLLVWRIRKQQAAGSYLVIDAKKRTIALPRPNVTFPFAAIDRFQLLWTRHYRKLGRDLCLIIQNDAGELVRHHIMCNPSRSLLDQIVDMAGLPLEERDTRPVGAAGFLSLAEPADTDRHTINPFR